MSLSAILDSIRVVEVKDAYDNLELYRKRVLVSPAGAAAPVYLSVFDLSPEKPEQTLVLVHGFAASTAWWRGQLLPLAQRNRVIAMDLRGHGQSDDPPDGYTVAQMTEDLAGLLDNLGVTEPVVLAGHSAGGFIITDFALRYPQRASKLILIATPITVAPRMLPVAARFLMSLPEPAYQVAQPVFELDPKGRGEANLLGLSRFFEDMSHWDGESRFPKLTQPSLLLFGDRDYVFPEEYYTRVADLIPQVETVNIGVSQHQIPLERPKAVLRAIERFIAPGDSARFEPRWRGENDAINTVQLVAERPWVARYDHMVPAVLDTPRVALTRLLEYTAEHFGSSPAVYYRNQMLSYSDLYAESIRFALALHSLGIGKGDRVMLLLPNMPHLVIAFYGLLHLGAVAVMGSAMQPIDETIRQAQGTGVRLLVTGEALYAVAHAIRKQSAVQHIIYAGEKDYEPLKPRSKKRLPEADPLPISEATLSAAADWDAQIDHLWRPFLEAWQSTSSLPAAVSGCSRPEDIAALVFTPGTIGQPKGILLTHANLVASALQVEAWLSDLKGKLSVLCAVPFCHVYGLTMGMNLAIRLRASMLLLSDLEPGTIVEQVRRNKPAIFVATPALYRVLNGFKDVGAYLKGAVQWCISGTAPLPVEVKEAFERLTRGRLIESYGLSEACQFTHFNPLNNPRTGSIGLPLPATEARIVDLATGEPLPFGQVGEMVVRGPQVMQGYLQDEAATRAVLDSDGWLYTGDVAHMDDDGYFHILGRRQDIWMDDNNTPVFPRDVEEALYELPEVCEVVVMAISNVPVAFIRLRGEETLTTEMVLEFCRQRLPHNHLPQRIFFVDALPYNYIGEVLREELIRMYVDRLQEGK